MKIEYDKDVDALYIRIQEKDVARTQEVSDGVNLDFDDLGRLIGLEVLSAIETLRFSRYLQSLHRESDIDLERAFSPVNFSIVPCLRGEYLFTVSASKPGKSTIIEVHSKPSTSALRGADDESKK